MTNPKSHRNNPKLSEDVEIEPVSIPNETGWIYSGIDMDTREIEISTGFSFEQLSPHLRAFKRMITISNAPIYIHISSYGGDLSVLLAFFDWVKIAQNRGIKVHTIASGAIESAGAFLFLAGNDRLMTQNTHILIHTVTYANPFGTPQTGATLLVTAKESQDILIDILAKNTKKGKQYWSDCFKSGDVIFNSKAAVKLGIATKVLK